MNSEAIKVRMQWLFDQFQNQFCSRSNNEEEAQKTTTFNIDQNSQKLFKKDQSEYNDKNDCIDYSLYKTNETQQQQRIQDQNRTIIPQSGQNIEKKNYQIKRQNGSPIEQQEHYQLDKPTIKEKSNVIQILKDDSSIVKQQNSEIIQNSDIKIQDQNKDNLFSSIAKTSQQICDGCGVLITTDMKQTNCRHVFHEKCYHQMLVEQIIFKKKPKVQCYCTQQIRLFKNSSIEKELFEQLMRNQLEILKFKVKIIFKCQKCNFFAFCETSKCIDCDELQDL